MWQALFHGWGCADELDKKTTPSRASIVGEKQTMRNEEDHFSQDQCFDKLRGGGVESDGGG